MAHLRKHAKSPFWYIRKRTYEGKWVESSTGFRVADPEETARAKRLAERSTIAERADWSIVRGNDFRAWVPSYLANRYRLKSKGTMRRTEIAWHTIQTFLVERQLFFPRQLKYRHADEYMNWRIGRAVNRRKACYNTARLELKFLSQIMSEAVRRELADSNPFLAMEVPLAPQKQKKTLSDAEIAAAREAVKGEAPWMERVFEIMLWTGCRFTESAIPLERIDFDGNTITMVDSKRAPTDPKRLFIIPIPSDLRPMLERIRDNGETVTVELTREKNWRFNRFLKRITGASSHSLRVTFVTRCHLSGLSERQARRLVNHSSRAIHDVYSRLSADDVRLVQAQIQIPRVNALPAEPATS